MMTFELLTPRSPITPTKTLPGEHYVSGMEKSVAEDDCDRQDDFEDDQDGDDVFLRAGYELESKSEF